jgi:hypothetical protein
MTFKKIFFYTFLWLSIFINSYIDAKQFFIEETDSERQRTNQEELFLSENKDTCFSTQLKNRVPESETISLAGKWKFKLDPEKKGLSEKWFKSILPENIYLPGSCEEQGYGIKTPEPELDRLTRILKYEGPAWYQRVIDVPDSWEGKNIQLFLERCHWETDVWLDERPLGKKNSLSVPHVYELGKLSRGKHILTICVDNAYKIAIGRWGSAITEDSQGNWNGIIGRIELQANDPVWIKSVQVYSEKMKVRLCNRTGRILNAKIESSIPRLIKNKSQQITIPQGETEVELPVTKKAQLWDEFSPGIKKLTLTLKAEKFNDSITISYSIRKLNTKDKQFTLNGRPVLLRGCVNECVYPLSGYSPMDKAAWLRTLGICKSYGFNFMRFHSWCPPEAAFEAGDELGFLFQVELPLWTLDAPPFGHDQQRDQFIYNELKSILSVYGHHPSFAFMAMGNESSGALDSLVKLAQELDPQHIYRSEGSGTLAQGDYMEIGERGVMGPSTNWDRSSFWGWIPGNDSGSNLKNLPILDHEDGQWGMYPDFDGIRKFKGNYQPFNYKRFRKSLESHHMLYQDKAFATASGKFSVLLYKEEIEACERTYPFGGFEILEARDHPGQGTAIVGWLDAFWDSKGLITPEEFRRFCAPTVCLLRMSKRIYTVGDLLVAEAEIAHYGSKSITVKPSWKITDSKRNIIARGNLNPVKLETGRVTKIGNINLVLGKVFAPAQLTVTLRAAGTSNSWNIWVYPDLQVKVPPNIIIAHEFDSKTLEALESGKRVLLFSSPKEGIIIPNRAFYASDSVRYLPLVSAGRNSIPGSFMPVFWNTRLFNQIGTLGILCDPKNPALADFSTESNSNWQWADLLGRFSAAESFRVAGAPLDMCDTLEKQAGDKVDRSKAIILDETPKDFKPIVQAIDNYDRNAKLGIVFETRVGKGKLLVCAMDLETDADKRPAARQLEQSLLNYIAGDKFLPTHELSKGLLEKLLLP